MKKQTPGSALFLKIDVTSKGKMVGIDPIQAIPKKGVCFQLYYTKGQVYALDVFVDGAPDASKYVAYDTKGRVSELALFRNNQLVDSWRYIYGLKGGLRSKKIVVLPGGKIHTEIRYDNTGKRVGEKQL